MFFLSDTMKFLIVFALAFATVSTKHLYSCSIEAPVLEKEGRITHGKKAAPGQFYYQVGLSLKNGRYTYWCGGSLIGHSWILTTAHCNDGVSSGKVYLGATQRLVAEKTYNISEHDIIIHPHWKSQTYKNDICLIKIPTTSESSKIGIVRIPSKRDPNTYIGFRVVISGWGYISDFSEQLSNDLLYGILTVSPGSVCSKYFKSFYDDDINVCVATPNGVSTCHADSGGPLVLDGQNLQIGVTTFGAENGCTKSFPIVFARIKAYLPWIKEHTEIDY